MKILILASANSSHTLKWVNSLNEKGHDIQLFSLVKPIIDGYNNNISIHFVKIPLLINKRPYGAISKITYIVAIFRLLRLIRKFKPDILHAHYASSYGLLGSISKFHPFFVSTWGDDVFSFPRITFLHKKIISFVFSKADLIFSTSNIMREEIKLYTNKLCHVIPFGVDIEKYRASHDLDNNKKDTITIGTVKSLEPQYGIPILLQAFSIIKDNFHKQKLKLIIIGGGSLLKNLMKLSRKLNIENDVEFLGYINHNDIVSYFNMIDIFVAVSVKESFGVSVVEASACQIPVIVSNIGGLPEIVVDGKTGIIVRANDPQATAKSIMDLINNTELRIWMGMNGRERVIEKYNWSDSVKQMNKFYLKYVK